MGSRLRQWAKLDLSQSNRHLLAQIALRGLARSFLPASIDEMSRLRLKVPQPFCVGGIGAAGDLCRCIFWLGLWSHGGANDDVSPVRTSLVDPLSLVLSFPKRFVCVVFYVARQQTGFAAMIWP